MDLSQHILRQRAFSRAIFGPGERTDMVIDHITSEIEEVKKCSAAHERTQEWLDVVLLALDGLWRSIEADILENEPRSKDNPSDIADDVSLRTARFIHEKQATNEMRDWPDWRTADLKRRIEHKREEA